MVPGKIWHDTSGDALVEATILFPIMVMVFAALALLAMYLPQEANLERAVQFAASSLAPENADMGYGYDENGLAVVWDFDLHNTYQDFFTGTYTGKNSNVYFKMINWVITAGALASDKHLQERADAIVQSVMASSIMARSFPIEVECTVRRGLIYSDIEITATQTIKMPVNLSFIGFPEEILIAKSAKCMVLDGDGFLRSADDAVALEDIARRVSDVVDFVSILLPY